MAKVAGLKQTRPGSQPESLRDQVYSILRLGLRTGTIRPNQHLREQSLSEQLGVSRTPIREALALLQRDGLLVATSKGLMLPNLTLKDIRDVYEIRKLLEPKGMRAIAEHANRSDIVALRSAIAAQEMCIRDRHHNLHDDLEHHEEPEVPFGMRRLCQDSGGQ